MPQNSVRILKIDETAQDRRLDAWLAEQCAPALSRSRLTKLIRGGQVEIDGKIISEPSFKPPVGAQLRLVMPPPAQAKPQPEAIKLDVLYEDGDIIVLNKPAGLVVHPGNGNPSGTLVNALIHHCAGQEPAGLGLSGIGGVKRPGIVHRLDKDTSGVMIAAKNDAAHLHLSRQFADHGKTGALERRYQALVWGAPPRPSGVIEAKLARAKYDRTRRAIAGGGEKDARNAVTHYKILRKFGAKADATAQAALVECRLETGRTHQIRVHMAHIGHPLLGDAVYGQGFKSKINTLSAAARAAAADFSRQALHAVYLRIEHPRTGEVMEFSAALPADMQKLISALAA